MVLCSTSLLADDQLPATRAEAIAMEAKDALPLTAFYDPPRPLEPAAAGTLIRSEPFGGYELPPGAHAVRILYHSRALNGADIAASGVVLVPLMQETTPEQLEWVRNRLSGKPWTSNCSGISR